MAADFFTYQMENKQDFYPFALAGLGGVRRVYNTTRMSRRQHTYLNCRNKNADGVVRANHSLATEVKALRRALKAPGFFALHCLRFWWEAVKESSERRKRNVSEEVVERSAVYRSVKAT